MIRRRSQYGATLLVALIMLVLLTLFAVSALNTSTTNLKAVGNMQARTEALNAAQQVVETAISSSQFTTTPADAVLNPCGTANTLCIDGAGNFVSSPTDPSVLYTVRLTPQPACVSVRAIKTSELNLALSADQKCVAGQSQQHGVAGAVSGDSLCANSVWDITAESVAAVSGAKVTVTQGVGQRISVDDMSTSCL
jgi:Tfp pilus assembly protein PilX